MERKIEFVLKSIEEAQETNRFLDTKAGVLVVFESSFLALIAGSLFNTSTYEMLQYIISRFALGYSLFLGIYFGLFVVVLGVNVILTLRLMFPAESPEEHIDTKGFEPRRLFFVSELDEDKRLRPSVVEYSTELANLRDGDILQEYIFELLKLSYIRNLKQARLATSFRLLQVLIIAIALYCLFCGLGMLMY